MGQKILPKGKTAQYKRLKYGPSDNVGMIVDVDMILEEGRWYARLWNDEAVIEGFMVGREEPIPVSPWCLDLLSFCERYEPVAPPPKIG